MRLAHIMLKPLAVADTSQKVEGVIVWQPYGWFAHIVLEGVTGPEFGELEDLIKGGTRSIQFMHGNNPTYNYRQEMAWIEMYDREHIDDFVRRGALRNPRVMLELGRSLFAKLELQLQQRRARRS